MTLFPVTTIMAGNVARNIELSSMTVQRNSASRANAELNMFLKPSDPRPVRNFSSTMLSVMYPIVVAALINNIV